jgi:hypothetical protein
LLLLQTFVLNTKDLFIVKSGVNFSDIFLVDFLVAFDAAGHCPPSSPLLGLPPSLNTVLFHFVTKPFSIAPAYTELFLSLKPACICNLIVLLDCMTI